MIWPTQVTTPDGHHWRYRYDPLGRRIAKEHYAPDSTTLIETTTFIWDGPLLAEQSTTSAAADGGAPAVPGTALPAHIITWEYRPGTFAALSQTKRTATAGAAQDAVDSQFYAIITDLIGTRLS